jgi:hypothetical protein
MSSVTEATMAERWNEFMRALHDAIGAFVQGDPEPYKALWSHADDVSILGGFGGHEIGWSVVGERLEWAATHYSPSWSFVEETIAEIVGTDMGMRVAFQTISGRTASGDAITRERRVTYVARLEQGGWRVVHQHSDPLLAKLAPTDAR